MAIGRLTVVPREVTRIRVATNADTEAVRGVIAAAYAEFESSLEPGLFRAYMSNLLELDSGAAGSVQLVADLGGEVVGAVMFYPDAGAATGFGWPDGWAALRALAVDPAHRGRGVGQLLVSACVERAITTRAPAIGLHTADLMSSAIGLYERLGFARTPDLDLRPGDLLGVDDRGGPAVIAYRLDLRRSELDSYPLGRSEAETRRLILQQQIYGPITRRFLVAAGISRGMKVLDLGSGAGDVALLLADLVGPEGHVVGVDMNAEILETARSRTRAAGWANVEFIHGDVGDLALPDDFDAVVGRWVLMYAADPAELLRRIQRHLRPGGIVACQESADLTAPVRAYPATPLHERICRWTSVPSDGPGPIRDMGLQLYRTFLDAGLPAPQLCHEAPIGGGPAWPGYAFVAGSMRSLLAFLEQLGNVDATEADVETLEDRLREELVDRRGVQILPTVIGAWSRSA